MNPEAPIGIFDSGIGGLSIAMEIRRELPNEHLIYVADSGFAPYGERPPEEITQRCRRIAAFLLEQGVKTIVVACNTATAAAIHSLRTEFNLPVIGVEPGLKPAALNTRNGTIGILATRGTLSSDKYNRLVDQHGKQVRVISQICDGLADQVENGLIQSEETRKLLNSYLSPLLQQGVDTIALGCTHYPFLKPMIHELDSSLDIIDTSQAVARETRRRLEARDLQRPEGAQSQTRFFTSGEQQRVMFNARLLCQELLPEKAERLPEL
jgi:glutamate racemase